MDVYFFDTSSIVKEYVSETGSVWVKGLVDPGAGNDIYLAGITGVEVISAIARRQRGGSLSTGDAAVLIARFRIDLATMYLSVGITPSVISNAMALAETHALRGYDAVQLSTALDLNVARTAAGLSALTLISADLDLNAAAVIEGLTVENPNHHP